MRDRDVDSREMVEFFLCGSPTDAFYSQIAFFRLSLDSLGPAGRAARVVAVFGGPTRAPLPDRWVPYYERIEAHQVSPEAFRREGYFATCDFRFELVSTEAAVSCLCDADTALLRLFPDSFLEDHRRHAAVSGVIAHFPFPVTMPVEESSGTVALYPGMPQELAWERLGAAVLGHAPDRRERYTLLEKAVDDRCPFYVNYGFLAGPPQLMARLHQTLREVQPRVAGLLGNEFCGQVAIALAVEKARIPYRVLPMRYNFPNDPIADRLYPHELAEVVVMHYLRYERYDRHRIFAEPAAFQAFLALELEGSDRVFREHVLRVTSGRYPFP